MIRTTKANLAKSLSELVCEDNLIVTERSGQAMIDECTPDIRTMGCFLKASEISLGFHGEVDGKIWKRLVPQLAEGEVELRDEEDGIEIRSGRFRAKVSCGQSTRRPIDDIAEGEATKEISFNAKEVTQALSACVKIFSPGGSDQDLLEMQDGRMISTDGYALACSPLTKAKDPIGLDTGGCQALAKCLGKGSIVGTINMVVGERVVQFWSEEHVRTIRRLNSDSLLQKVNDLHYLDFGHEWTALINAKRARRAGRLSSGEDLVRLRTVAHQMHVVSGGLSTPISADDIPGLDIGFSKEYFLTLLCGDAIAQLWGDSRAGGIIRTRDKDGTIRVVRCAETSSHSGTT